MSEACLVFTWVLDSDSDWVGVYVSDGRTNFSRGSIAVEEVSRFIKKAQACKNNKEELKKLFQEFGLAEDTSC